MATAVETSSAPKTPPGPPAALVPAALLAAAYVVAALAALFYLIPTVWRDAVSPALAGNSLLDTGLRVIVQGVAAVALLLGGRALIGANPPKGIHGGVFLVISLALTVFFLVRAVAMNVNGPGGLIATGVTAAVLLFFVVRFLAGRTGRGWMVGLEEQGWFHGHGYKKSLGQKVRRLTMLGIIVLGGSGVYSLLYQGFLPDNWTLAMPFDVAPVTLLPDAKFMVPLLLIGLTLWVAFRAVNVPPFAEFLIATEAEMNKVSWTPRKRLFQDTIVVLATTFLMTAFLLMVDLFWGWLLSRETVGVLPGKSTAPDKGGRNEAQKW